MPHGILITKGMDTHVDSYSAFFDNGNANPTPLEGILREKGVTKVYLVGVAYDYCLGSSAADCKKLGFDTYVIEDGTKCIAEDSSKAMTERLQSLGVKFVKSSDIL